MDPRPVAGTAAPDRNLDGRLPTWNQPPERGRATVAHRRTVTARQHRRQLVRPRYRQGTSQVYGAVNRAKPAGPQAMVHDVRRNTSTQELDTSDYAMLTRRYSRNHLLNVRPSFHHRISWIV